MALDTINNDGFNRAVAQCQGEIGVTLFNTLLSIGVNSVFLLLSIPSLFLLLRKPNIHRTPAALLISNLVRIKRLVIIERTPLVQCMAAADLSL